MSENPTPHGSKEQTYTEEMQRWMARQSFWYRLTHRRRHPDSRPILVSLMMILAWLVPLSAIFAFGYFLSVQKYLAGGNFSLVIAREAGKALSIHNPKVFKAQWKSGTLTLNDLKGEGKADGWVRKLSIGSIRFELPLKNMLADAWSPENLILQDVDLELRGGLLGQLEVEHLNRTQALEQAKAVQGDGFPGIHPDGDTFSVNRLIARNISIHWGLDRRSEGQISGSAMEANFRDGTWTLVFTGGKFSSGWLKGAEIDELLLLATPKSVEIKSLRFRLKAGEGSQIKDSQGSGEGLITVAPVPEIYLKLSLANLNINHLLTKDYQRIFAGQVNGKLTFKGTTARESGLTTEGAFEFVPGFGFGGTAGETFPILEVLGGEAVDIPLRHLETARGNIRFAISDKTVQSEGFVMEGSDGERIEGSFTHDFSANQITGAIRIGMKPEIFANHPLLAERFFREESPEFRWMTLPLKGPLSDCTTGTAETMRATLRQEAAAKDQRRP